MTTDTITALIRRAGDRWNAGDLPGYLELYDPNVVLHGYHGAEPGMDGVRRFYEGFWAALPGSQLVFDDIFAVEDRLACRYVVRGTHGGQLIGIAATGKTLTIPGITILRFSAGKCVERWNQADFLGALQQMGALPGAG
jgi:predicted ester cyclase